jgi:hypothetical protein
MMEVLVTLGIAAILAGLLLPSVVKSREASRRIQCTAHLKQLILACHAYESTFQRFPLFGPTAQVHFSLMPFLNLPEGTIQNPLFACPSDPLSHGSLRDYQQNYYVNHGTGDWEPDGFTGNYKSYLKVENVRDGLSMTSALGERLALPREAGTLVNWDEHPELWIRRMRDTRRFLPDVEEFAAECRDYALRPLSSRLGVSGYTHVMAPNQNSCINMSVGLRPRAVTSTSLHHQGVNNALGDGSVRFISNAIDRKTWLALATPRGRELISDF